MNGGRCAFCSQIQAKFSCSCSNPATLICAGCLAEHVETEGAHVPTLTQKKKAVSEEPMMGQGNEVCDECRTRAAVRFCLCSTPLRKFCPECDLIHYQKARNLTHSTYSMSAYQTVVSGRVTLEIFRKKQFYINDLQHHIDEELVQFDAFVRQVESEFHALIAQVTALKEALLKDLQMRRTTLIAQLYDLQQIIETKRYAESFEVITPLDSYILNGYSKSLSYPGKMFAGKLCSK